MSGRVAPGLTFDCKASADVPKNRTDAHDACDSLRRRRVCVVDCRGALCLHRGRRRHRPGAPCGKCGYPQLPRSEEHTSELQSLMRISYAVFCLKKKKNKSRRQKHEKEYKSTIQQR